MSEGPMWDIQNGYLDPFDIKKILWPDVYFYRKQRIMIQSVWEDDQTFVKGANEMGKDFAASFIVIAYFISRHPCKIVTTSVKDKHLNVLWAEIEKFLRISRYPLILGDTRTIEDQHYVGRTLTLNNSGMNKVIGTKIHKGSYVMKLVATEHSIESFLGHHVTPDPGQKLDDVPRNLFVGDEATGLIDDYYKKARTWAKRMLLFGNTWPCENFFRKAFQGDPELGDPGGDIPKLVGEKGLYRKTLTITAEDSPNVALGIIQEMKGEKPTNERLVAGIKSYSKYKEDRRFLDAADQAVVLDAVWYEGPELKLFPEEHRNAAMERADELIQKFGAYRPGAAMGVDTAEGGDSTVWTIGDHMGFIYQKSAKTPDTTVIPDITIELMREFKVPPESVLLDTGGGGYEHACELRKRGYPVHTVGFGESVKAEIRRGTNSIKDRKEIAEQKTVYINRRAEMYGMLSLGIHPGRDRAPVYGIPRSMTRMLFQLGKIPKIRDAEGRLWIPPKDAPPKSTGTNIITLKKLIGHSPDEADSGVMCHFKLFKKTKRQMAGMVR